MSSFNPIRRSPIKPKVKQAKVSAPWRSPKIRLDARGMCELRGEVFARAQFQCENLINGQRCSTKISWVTFHLHHIVHRSQGGSDTPANTMAVCWDCHEDHHRGRRRIEVQR